MVERCSISLAGAGAADQFQVIQPHLQGGRGEVGSELMRHRP